MSNADENGPNDLILGAVVVARHVLPDSDVVAARVGQRELAHAPRPILDQAFDQWLAYEDAVKSRGSVAAVAAADPEVLQGAFMAFEILLGHVPACAYKLPNGE